MAIIYHCLWCEETFEDPSNDAVAVTNLTKHMNTNHREKFGPDPNAIPLGASDA